MKSREMCPVEEEGGFCGIWYIDIADAEEQLMKLRAGHPDIEYTIEVTPLSKAFALSERWVGDAAPGGFSVPLKLQASTAELARLPGFPPLPEELRGAFNPRTDRLPVWQMDELKGMPFFFHYEDLVIYWMTESGQCREEMPQDGLDVRDLREVVARMTFQPLDWMGQLKLIAPRRSVEMSTQVMPPKPADPLDEPPPLEGDTESGMEVGNEG
eukprot:CAMPEP_0181215380 /NCGR_PEP_ID=MMETSP1096-20121128/25980_1 /TAXON_ID=156174 ORGANISM="Chrysochromulina ericina, Strain CCMP281" /NCGR_SAMPLE_ID=MMETSP1096 /ASSEMBLY_ACC=CAM_ASM_000453 /LENGTH=212 /DNA_ID=CAMNT_0023307227 /DNA_START=98 /DNA_END=736 /DNA_ORIENTATION=-